MCIIQEDHGNYNGLDISFYDNNNKGISEPFLELFCIILLKEDTVQDKIENIFRIDDEFSFLTKELLETEYKVNKLTDKQIAEKYKIGSKATVWRRRKFWGIENSYSKKSNKNALKNRSFNISIEDAKLYLEQGLTYAEIAEKMRCSRMVAYRRMKELGLISDQFSNFKKLKWHEPISDLQNRFILGCLLGDGNLTSRGMFQCNHSHKQKEYIEYKFNILNNLIPPDFKLRHNTILNHQNGKTYSAYYMRTMQNENLKKIYDQFYKGDVKQFPYEFLIDSNFDAYSLAIWYMDDGGRSGSSCNIHTESFCYFDNVKILEFLHGRFNICGVLQELKSKNGNDSKYYIRFNIIDADKFFKIVSPYIHNYFNYKLPEKHRKDVKG